MFHKAKMPRVGTRDKKGMMRGIRKAQKRVKECASLKMTQNMKKVERVFFIFPFENSS